MATYPLLDGETNLIEFFANLEKGDYFEYYDGYFLKEVEEIALQHGVKIRYVSAKDNYSVYSDCNCLACKVIEVDVPLTEEEKFKYKMDNIKKNNPLLFYQWFEDEKRRQEHEKFLDS